MHQLILILLVLVSHAIASCQTRDVSAGQKYIGIITSATGKTTQITLTFDAQTAKAYISSSLGLTNQETTVLINSTDSLWFELPGFSVVYKGKYQGSKSSIVGIWQQSTKSLELRFERQSSSASPEQGLSSNKPNSIDERKVTIAAASGITLGGTLTIPSGLGKYPAIILLGVAGETDRDMSFGPYKSFRTIAETLTKAGFVVLRCDDRGVGESKGSLYQADYEYLIADARQMLAFLRKQSFVDSAKVGVLGISEGAALAGILAGQNDVAFAVMLSYPALNGDETIRRQIIDLSIVYSFSSKQQTKLLENFATIKTLIQTSDNTPRNEAVKISIKAHLEKADPEVRNLSRYFMIPTDADQASTLYASTWYRAQLNYKPTPYLRAVQCPALFLYGRNDPFVNPAFHTPELDKYLKQPRHTKTKIVVFENINHIFQDAVTGSPLEYINNNNDFSKKALHEIEQWLREVSK